MNIIEEKRKTNKDALFSLDDEAFYRKTKQLMMIMSKKEFLKWLREEVVDMSDISTPKFITNNMKIQKCPYCGHNWQWSKNRWNEARRKGTITITCKSCKNDFVAWTCREGIVNRKVN